MGFELSEKQHQLVDNARAFATHELAPHAVDGDRNHHFPVEADQADYLALYIKKEDSSLRLSRLSSSLSNYQLDTSPPQPSSLSTTWPAGCSPPLSIRHLKDAWLPHQAPRRRLCTRRRHQVRVLLPGAGDAPA